MKECVKIAYEKYKKGFPILRTTIRPDDIVSLEIDSDESEKSNRCFRCQN
jgi:hypothetical protein